MQNLSTLPDSINEQGHHLQASDYDLNFQVSCEPKQSFYHLCRQEMRWQEMPVNGLPGAISYHLRFLAGVGSQGGLNFENRYNLKIIPHFKWSFYSVCIIALLLKAFLHLDKLNIFKKGILFQYITWQGQNYCIRKLANLGVDGLRQSYEISQVPFGNPLLLLKCPSCQRDLYNHNNTTVASKREETLTYPKRVGT